MEIDVETTVWALYRMHDEFGILFKDGFPPVETVQVCASGRGALHVPFTVDFYAIAFFRHSVTLL